MNKSMLSKYIAEFLGTLILTLAVALSLAGTFPVPTPVIAGLALGLCVYTLGTFSGAHVNPAITLGLLLIKRISMKDAGIYIVMQVLGAFVAMMLARYMVAPVAPPVVNGTIVIIAEAVGTFMLALGVASVVHEKVPVGAAGLTIGGALLLGISLAAVNSNGMLNPAVAFGVGSFSLGYVIGPIVGSALGMLLYKYLTD